MKIIAILPAYNEANRIGKILTRFTPPVVDDIFLVDDGSTDGTGKIAASFGAKVVTHAQKMGVGEGIKDGIKYALENDYDLVVIMAANGKDDPQEIPQLIKPILDDECDYVQGSRFLKNGKHINTPLSRVVAIKAYSLIWSIVMGEKITDITNGFRAYKTSIFQNKEINIWQEWLGTYELEYYLHYKVIKCDYRVKEVPVSKIYPASGKYTKIRAFLDWWRIIKPFIYLTLGIKK